MVLPPVYGEPYPQDLWETLNQQRIQQGLLALEIDPVAQKAADSHAKYLVQHRVLSHWSGSERVLDRYRNLGGTALAAGENLGVGETWQDVFTAWLESPSHRDNLFSPQWRCGAISQRPTGDGRVLMVAIFTSSRWVVHAMEVQGQNLLLEGRVDLRGDLGKSPPVLRMGSQFFEPEFLSSQVPSLGFAQVRFLLPLPLRPQVVFLQVGGENADSFLSPDASSSWACESSL
ncbi:MAG: CAP domain-containing protein [Spirochaetales bacterium]|nr:CAP domain-containing protein [Spirochaetales bacterium]